MKIDKGVRGKMVVSYQWGDGHWYEYRCYKKENFYYRMWIEI